MPAENTTVCLSFDFDAISVWIGSFGVQTPTAMSRGEFGAKVGTPRILNLLEREGVPSSWYIPGLDAETFPDVCKRIRDAGHEIGHHGYCHENPAALDEAVERRALERGLEALDAVLGVRAAGYRSPGFDLSPNSTRLLQEYGFAYDTSMMGSDFELYRCRVGDVFHTDRAPDWGQEVELVEVPISWTLDDFPFIELVVTPRVVYPASTDVAAMAQRWIDDLDFLVDELPGGVFTLTLHPQSIGRASRLRLLESVIRHGKERGGRFSTVADAVAAWSDR
jgi:peptidoglycan/xylan/chitin deacetylase (PgdA/CDA1 family)